MKMLRRIISKIKHIKRHIRNRKLSKAIDEMYYNMFQIPIMLIDCHCVVHPLTYEILRLRHCGELFLTKVHPHDLITNYTEIIAMEEE